MRGIPGAVEIRLTDKDSYEFEASDAALVFFADSPPDGGSPPVAHIVEGELLGELPDEACIALGYQHLLDLPERRAE